MAAALARTGALTWEEAGAARRRNGHAADPAQWGDVILARKDAPASYHLAVTVDDAAQGITDVVRGQDLFHATSVHRLLQSLLGLPAPRYHHHRLILDAEGRKLSKSTKATGLRELRGQGATRRISARPSGSIERGVRVIVPFGAEGGWLKRSAKSRSKSGPKSAKSRAGRTPSRAAEAALAGIAHDIRTPLTGIVALAELLASSNLGPREREWANAVKSGADHLAGLTSLIVDAVKADAAKLVLRNEPFSPRALAEAVGQALTARAGNKSVSAQIDIAPDLPAMVTGDVLRLRAALENLADNAVKFTTDGTVAFSAKAEPAARGARAFDLSRSPTAASA